MSSFQRPDISYKPLEVDASPVQGKQFYKEVDSKAEEAVAIGNKLMDHLAIIQAYKERLDAIDFLIDNAKSLAGNLSYTTDDPTLQMSIKNLEGKENIVDFKLFEKAIDIVIKGYGDMALISLTGVMNK